MIFLRDNALLERKLVAEDIKNRLLGHWGTCPGLSLVHAHLNRLISKHNLDMLYVVGPGKSRGVASAFKKARQLT
jgi:xylulose-5-phosphate/fructose-6-phosphate phosphoketolase